MNYGISILFRAIPLLMALFCFGYGAFVLHEGLDSAKFVAGPVVFSLGMICIALFATAATIIRQIIHTYNPIARYALPVIGYLAAVLTVIYGWNYMHEAATASNFVAGHVICGVGFITACVATTATASTRFTLIPANSERTDQLQPADAFNSSQGYILIAVATLMAVMAWIWAFWLLSKSSEHNAYYVAGHVMAGLACICSSLVALVATIVRQIRNNYTKSERKQWPALVLIMGSISILWGLLVLTNSNPALSSTGYIMIAWDWYATAFPAKSSCLPPSGGTLSSWPTASRRFRSSRPWLVCFSPPFCLRWQACTMPILSLHAYWLVWEASALHYSPS